MRHLLLSLLFVIGLSSIAWAKSEKQPRRIHFDKGQTEVVVSGRLKNRKDVAVYVLRLRAGQTIEVHPDGGTISVSTSISDPAGQDKSDHDMQGNSGIENTVAGDYRVTVSWSGKDDRQNGTFRIRIKVNNAKTD